MLGVASDRPACLYGGTLGFGPWAHGMALAPSGGAVTRGLTRALPNIIFMTLVLGVASDRPACLYGGTLGFGPWAHGMALAP